MSVTTDHNVHVVRALGLFGLPAPDELTVIRAGLMNRNWSVRCAGARYALKQVRDVAPGPARTQHTATTAMAAAGLPVPSPVIALDGDTLVEVAGEVYSLARWVDGVSLAACTWSTGQAEQIGALLGELHRRLAELMPPTEATVWASVGDPDQAAARITGYQDRIAALGPKPRHFDKRAALALARRARLLERWANQRPEPGQIGPAGWAHGDFHDLNLLWKHGRVSAVLDWDRLGVRAYAGEVVRSATLMFGRGDERGLDLELVAAFVTGYRKMTGLEPEPLADAAERLWWERICDVWQLRRHYEQGDDSCDHLFVSASALITWWCEHRGEVTAALTAG